MCIVQLPSHSRIFPSPTKLLATTGPALCFCGLTYPRHFIYVVIFRDWFNVSFFWRLFVLQLVPVFHSLLLLSNIPVYRRTTLYPFITWGAVVFNFWLFQVVLLWTPIYKFICRHMVFSSFGYRSRNRTGMFHCVRFLKVLPNSWVVEAYSFTIWLAIHEGSSFFTCLPRLIRLI